MTTSRALEQLCQFACATFIIIKLNSFVVFLWLRMGMFCAAIFDWDGTLADSRAAVVASFQCVLKKRGCYVDDEFIEKRIGIGARNTFAEALRTANISFDSSILEDFVREKTKDQIEHIQNVQLFEGALRLLQSLQDRVKMGLASSNNREMIERILIEKKVRRYFDVTITVEDVLKPKPDPEIFLKCARELYCHPRRCVVLEDSIFGVKAAKKAGMKCIAILSGAHNKKELKDENADLVVSSLSQTELILRFILEG